MEELLTIMTPEDQEVLAAVAEQGQVLLEDQETIPLHHQYKVMTEMPVQHHPLI